MELPRQQATASLKHPLLIGVKVKKMGRGMKIDGERLLEVYRNFSRMGWGFGNSVNVFLENFGLPQEARFALALCDFGCGFTPMRRPPASVPLI